MVVLAVDDRRIDFADSVFKANAARTTPFPGGTTNSSDDRQVFWLTDHSTRHAFSERRHRVAIRRIEGCVGLEWLGVAFVPDYSGGTAVELHHLPLSPP